MLEEMEQAGMDVDAAKVPGADGQGRGAAGDAASRLQREEDAELEARLEHIGSLVGASLAER